MLLPLGLGGALEAPPSRTLIFSPVFQDVLNLFIQMPNVGECFYSPTFVLWQWDMTVPGENVLRLPGCFCPENGAAFTFAQEIV